MILPGKIPRGEKGVAEDRAAGLLVEGREKVGDRPGLDLPARGDDVLDDREGDLLRRLRGTVEVEVDGDREVAATVVGLAERPGAAEEIADRVGRETAVAKLAPVDDVLVVGDDVVDAEPLEPSRHREGVAVRIFVVLPADVQGNEDPIGPHLPQLADLALHETLPVAVAGHPFVPEAFLVLRPEETVEPVPDPGGAVAGVAHEAADSPVAGVERPLLLLDQVDSGPVTPWQIVEIRHGVRAVGVRHQPDLDAADLDDQGLLLLARPTRPAMIEADRVETIERRPQAQEVAVETVVVGRRDVVDAGGLHRLGEGGRGAELPAGLRQHRLVAR